jgi:hypothetical protein
MLKSETNLCMFLLKSSWSTLQTIATSTVARQIRYEVLKTLGTELVIGECFVDNKIHQNY